MRIFLGLGLILTLAGCPGKIKGSIEQSLTDFLKESFYIDPSVKSIVASTDLTLVPKNNIGEVKFKIANGNGSVSELGVYNSQGYSGLTSIQAEDSKGRIAYINLNIVPQLKAHSTESAIMVNKTGVIVVQGGQVPYSYKIQSGLCEVDSKGKFTAPAQIGSCVIQVSDALGQLKNVEIEVVESLHFSAPLYTMLSGESKLLAAIGGVGQLKYTVAGYGSIDVKTGLFVAPLSNGVSIVKVEDEGENEAFTMIQIVGGSTQASLRASPLSLTLSVGQKQKFSVADGEAPYTLELLQNSVGSVDGLKLEYSATQVGSANLRIRDQRGAVSSVIAVTVKDPITVGYEGNEMTLAPGSITQLTPSGGESPFVFRSIIGSVVTSQNGTNADYHAPQTAGFDVLTITDSLGNSTRIYITIKQGLSLSPNPAKIARDSVLQFFANGGVEPYKFSVVGDEGATIPGGSATSGQLDKDTGFFRAPSTGGEITVRVIDADGLMADSIVTVYDSLYVEPFVKNSRTDKIEEISIYGGLGKLSLLVTGGGLFCESDASCTRTSMIVDSGQGIKVKFKTSSISGVNQINISDEGGNSTTSVFHVADGLSIASANTKLIPNEESELQILGGIPPFALSVESGPGSINQINESKFAYKAPESITSSSTVVIKVTDSDGTVATANLFLYPPLSLSPPNLTLSYGQTGSFIISGGSGDYSVTKISGPGTLGSIQNSNTFNFTAAANEFGLTTIQVADGGTSQQHKLQMSIRTNESVTPSVTGMPSGTNRDANLNVTIGGTNIVEYRYSLIDANASCATAIYSTAYSIATPIISAIGSDGDYKLCVIVKTASGAWQDPSAATSSTWSKREGPTNPSISISSGASYSQTSLVNLALSGGGAVGSYLTEDPICATGGVWQSFSSVGSFTFSSGEGAKTLYAKFRDSAGTESLCVSDSITIDTTAPPLVTAINDGTYSNSITQSPTISFNTGTDSGSGINKTQAQIVLGSDVNQIIKSWFDIANGQAITNISPNLVNGTTYKLQLRNLDNAGNISTIAFSDGWTIDTTTPSAIATIDDGASTTVLNSSPATSWSASSDTESGISNYEVAIGTTSGATDVTNGWVAVGNVLAYTITSKVGGAALTLSSGSTYFTSVRAKDNAGNYSAQVNGNGWTVSVAVSAFKMGGTSSDTASEVGSDANNNIYVFGHYLNTSTNTNGTLDFAGNSILGKSTGANSAVFVAKLDPSGNQLWFKSIRANNSVSGFSFAVDSAGNSVVGVRYYNNTGNTNLVDDFAGNPLLGKNATAGFNAGVLKLDTNGNQLWVKRLGGKGQSQPMGLAIDGSGNVFVSGYFDNDTVNTNAITDFAGANLAGKSSVSMFAAFIAKLDSAGTQSWIKVAGNNSSLAGVMARGVGVDGTGNVYVSGNFYNSSTNSQGATDFAGAALNGRSSSATGDAYVAKLNTSGTQQWIRTLGGDSGDYADTLRVSSVGNVYVGGYFYNTTTGTKNAKDFSGANLLGFSSPTGTLASDGYIAKINTSGTQQWIKKFGGLLSDSLDSIALDSSENVYVGGYFNENNSRTNLSVDFANNNLTGRGASLSNDALFAKLDTAGVQQFAYVIGGTSSDNVGKPVVTSSGKVIVPVNITNDNINSNGAIDLFGNPHIGFSAASSMDVMIQILNP